MAARVTALAVAVAAGFVIAWARLSDPAVIRDMLLQREAHVFLIMGSAIVAAAVGPGPLAAVFCSGNVAALFVAAGLVVGIRLQPPLVRSYRRTTHRMPELTGSIGL